MIGLISGITAWRGSASNVWVRHNVSYEENVHLPKLSTKCSYRCWANLKFLTI
jgi:hypothetical protein